jgi:hypothetical protein
MIESLRNYCRFASVDAGWLMPKSGTFKSTAFSWAKKASKIND